MVDVVMIAWELTVRVVVVVPAKQFEPLIDNPFVEEHDVQQLLSLPFYSSSSCLFDNTGH